MKFLLVQDFLEISYRADPDLLLGRWLRSIGLEETQRGYQRPLDVRRRQNTHQAGARWMVSTPMPQLGPRLGARTRLAYLMAPVCLRDQAADAAFPPAACFVDKPFGGERFVEENPAIAWLSA